jgi:predicted AlkP superfamily phosphohydrolase/phosphomutase
MRVIIIALDGATFDILDPWLDGGHLPTLQKLRDGGAKAQLMTTFPPITAAAWNSFATGKNPGKHGIFEFLQRRADSYDVEPMNASKRKARSLWRILSDAGKRVIVVNVPTTYPPEPVRGSLVAGMPIPANRKDFAYPAELSDEILGWLPDYEINASSVYIRGKADDFLGDIRTKLNQRLTVTERLMERGDWDFAMVHILGTDRIQHEFWHCMDATHPAHVGEAAHYKDAILDFFRDVDGQLARILKFADDKTTVMVISDHGFGPLHKFVYLNTWLLQQGFLRLKRHPVTMLKRLAFRLGFSPTNVYRLVSKLGLGGMRGGMDMGRRQKLLDTLFLSFKDVDWKRSKAYARGNFGQIFLNVKGREPQGIVQPGDDYARTIDEIIARLPTLIDPATKAPIVERAETRDALFSGGQIDCAPDIAVFMRDETYVGLGTADFPANTVAEKAVGNTGDHRYNGILLMNGYAIQPGDLGRASLMDIAPTVLHLMGQPVPSDMDGDVLLKGLNADFQQVSSVEVTPESSPADVATDYTAEEEKEIMQHLQDLGYLG